jgi:predicted Zn finger-like uncharacterized protein
MPTVTCPHCGLQRDLDAARLAPRRMSARCPQCRQVFELDGAALLVPSDAPLELDWGDRRQASEAPPPVGVPAPEAPAPAPDRAGARAPEPEPVAPPWRDLSAGREVAEPPGEEALRFGTEDWRVDALALPAAFGLAYLAKVLVLPGFLLDWFRAWLHEFGHASAAWLCSHAATPLVLAPNLAWANMRPEKSAFVYVCFLFLIGVTGYRAMKARSRFLFTFAAALLLLQVLGTFVLGDRTSDVLFLFAGCGGELVLGTVLMAGFYYRLPDRLRWDFFRYPFLVAGAYAFGAGLILWLRALHDRSAIPWGTGFGGRDDPGGDMNRLVDLGWSIPRLTHAYVALALACGAVIAIHYVGFLVRGRGNRANREKTHKGIAP